MPENSGVRPRNSATDSARGTVGPAVSSAISRRGRGRARYPVLRGLASARTAGAASAGAGAWPTVTCPGVTWPTSTQPSPAANRQTAPKIQACWNAAWAVAGVGVPMTATTIATPSAAPIWRATEFIPVAVAKLPSGAEPTAVPLRFGNSVPAPIPSKTIPGSHSPAKSGVIPTRSTNHITAPPQNKPPATRTGRGPMRWASRLAGPATTTATTGPAVSARPACNTEYRHRAVRNKTFERV